AFLVVVVSSASLVLARVAPGDFVTDELGVGAHRETIERTRVRYGLDRPVLLQYRDWLLGVVRFDFGRSFAYDRPVADLIPERAGNTAVLAVSALLVATVIGFPLGVLTASRRGGLLPAAVRAASMLVLSMPPLIMSLLLVVVASWTGLLPVGGMHS